MNEETLPQPSLIDVLPEVDGSDQYVP